MRKWTVVVPLAVLTIGIIMCAGGNRKETLQVRKVIGAMNGEPVVPREANRLLIKDFTDITGEAVLARKLYLRVKDHIARDGRLGIVDDGSEYELVLRGQLRAYEVQPVRFNDIGLPVKKRMRIVASIHLSDKVRKKEILHDPELQSFQEYSDIIPPVTSELAVQDTVIDNLAKRIARKVISGWYTELMTPEEKGKR